MFQCFPTNLALLDVENIIVGKVAVESKKGIFLALQRPKQFPFAE
jgi:hypothetical protein